MKRSAITGWLLRVLGMAYDRAEDLLRGREADLVLPDFLGIGAQKAGSTWLADMLRCHPQIYIPPRRKLHYFDRNAHRSLRFYSRFFEPGRDKVKGEVTAAYSILPAEQVRSIARIMPRLRVILLMRNPVERAWSHALMDLVEKTRRNYDEVPKEEFLRHFRSPASIKRSDYPAILSAWEGAFAREQIFVGFFEDLKHRPRELLSDIFAHVRVSREPDWGKIPYAEPRNRGCQIPMPQEYRKVLQDIHRGSIERLYERFGERVAAWRC